jgi:hypothetical protein
VQHVVHMSILVLYRDGAHWQIPCNNVYIEVHIIKDRQGQPWIRAIYNVMKLWIVNTLCNLGVEGYTVVDECYSQYVKESMITTMLGKANLPRLVKGFKLIQTFVNTKVNSIVLLLTNHKETGLEGRLIK